MRRILINTLSVLVLLGLTGLLPQNTQAQPTPPNTPEWISLFDGESLAGWSASEKKETFSVEDGRIVARGGRSHLFYTGSVENHRFDDFEFKVDVMTEPGTNSGLFFPTEYQETGWPSKGYEVQINNTETGPRKTGSLFPAVDVPTSPVGDHEWFTIHVRVKGQNIQVDVDGETMVDYTEPANPDRSDETRERVLSEGTIALQGHGPESTVYFKNIYVRPLK